ncbi:uracil-DNA glycosylase [Aureimonas altamirensis]|uniref:uracil-DNA glycosylase n=1 Tax=Aureimonas altamirensis TaxID=370622 RepID=UPI002036E9B6|nr:uracil-DNA glycosylase [Aureimonas altamirensis]MCM2505126.1 uracil-DNA glycosylase [Aureimonas altamirensis]
MTIFEPATPNPQTALAALLRWFDTAGIDGFVGETARNRFEETATESAARKSTSGPPQARPVVPQPGRPAGEAQARKQTPAATPLWSTPVPGTVAAEDAREKARHAASLAELQAAYAAFEGCALKATAKSLVFGNGPENASLMLIGEAPGREEDIAGEPFVGRSGQLLNRMLAAIGLERTDVRVTNVIAWRPPGNRSPTPAETEMCLPFVLRQIELVAPRVVVCLGSPSAKAVLSSNDGIMKLRGRWSELALPGLPAPVQATALLHPAYLLRQPAQKRLAWRDLLAVRDRLHRD